jgi:ribosomal protein L39E
MSRNKPMGRKLRLAAAGKVRSAPRWADIKKFGLKRARTRRIRVSTKNWRRGKLKVG